MRKSALEPPAHASSRAPACRPHVPLRSWGGLSVEPWGSVRSDAATCAGVGAPRSPSTPPMLPMLAHGSPLLHSERRNGVA
jgi:hypothetical protein